MAPSDKEFFLRKMKQNENSSCSTAVLQPLSPRSGVFSPNLKCGLKGREFYSKQEKRKIAEQLAFFSKSCTESGKIETCFEYLY